MIVIKVSGLTKDYTVKKKESTSTKLASLRHLISPPTTKLRALKTINFELNEGEFLGYIGPNGSGKSTTIKLLTGVLTPTEGSASVLGYTPWKRQKAFTRQIGVIFGNKSLLFWDLPVLDSLKLYKDVYNLNKEEFEDRLEEFNKIFQLSQLINRPVRKLSLGERMRSEIAAALIHNPPVLFLDEPTIGLDSLAKQEITAFLKKYQQREKTTVILTTHTISDIEALCERVIILNLGEIIYDGSISSLKGRFDDRTIHLSLRQTDGSKLLKEYGEMTTRISEFQYEVKTTKESVRKILAELINLDLGIADIKINEPNLETIIREIYQWSADKK
ncbi:MAG: ATP-binding cassette domain-containing protein [Promethearchaeota archaeon]